MVRNRLGRSGIKANQAKSNRIAVDQTFRFARRRANGWLRGNTERGSEEFDQVEASLTKLNHIILISPLSKRLESTNPSSNFELDRPKDRVFAYSHFLRLFTPNREKYGDRQDACPTVMT
jgi:hypothetical protein